jgi:histidine triad (HIT) family protein
MTSIFSKIIAGEIPGHFIWRDDQVVAFMTIAPIRPGHVLVVPVEEIDHWDELPEALYQHCLKVSQSIAGALKAVYRCKRVALQIIGLEVPHAHIHLMPLDKMADASFENARQVEADELAENAHRIRTQLQSMGYVEAEV